MPTPPTDVEPSDSARSAEVPIIIALARCGLGANPTPAVRHQIQRLAGAWRAGGREDDAVRLEAVLAPVSEESRGIRFVRSGEALGTPPGPGRWQHLHNGDQVEVDGRVCEVLTNDRSRQVVGLREPTTGAYLGEAPYADLR